MCDSKHGIQQLRRKNIAVPGFVLFAMDQLSHRIKVMVEFGIFSAPLHKHLSPDDFTDNDFEQNCFIGMKQFEEQNQISTFIILLLVFCLLI